MIAGPVCIVCVGAPADVPLAEPDNCTDPEDCVDPENCVGPDSCARPDNSAGLDNCAGLETCVECQSEGAKLGPGAETVSTVSANLGISERTGAAGIWIGASMVGAMACAPALVACAVFLRSACGIAG